MSDSAIGSAIYRRAVPYLARLRMSDPGYLASVVLRRGSGDGKEGDCCLIQEERRMLAVVATELGVLVNNFILGLDPAIPLVLSPVALLRELLEMHDDAPVPPAIELPPGYRWASSPHGPWSVEEAP